MITHHTKLIQALIDKYGLKSYLEIGIFNPDHNFNKIKCEWKQGIEPDKSVNHIHVFCGTSDEYFATRAHDFKIDIAFLDGDHTKEQIKKDFENSLRCLSDNGFIVIHDVLPENEAGTIVPRETKVWWGTVYQFAMEVYKYRCQFVTYNIDNGCMVVSKKQLSWPGTTYRDLPAPIEPTWENFQQHKQRLLRITDEVTI